MEIDGIQDEPMTLEQRAEALGLQRVDLAKFKLKLAKMNLRLNDVGADGNCFFRAVADQLFGYEIFHIRLRREVVEHMRNNKDKYSLFIEDDIDFDKYLNYMGTDGIWGGQLEMSVLAELHNFNVIVYQIDFEDMAQEFHPWDTKDLKTIHLSYHQGRHYNSVRSMSDPGRGPAIDFPI